MLIGLSSTDYTSLVNSLSPTYCPSCPPGLAVAVMNAESSGNPNAVSSAGAIGLFQLVPATAAGLGVNPTNPTQNIQGGLTYLQQMYDAEGNWNDALIAYNEGPGAFASGIRNSGSISYASGILANAGISSDPASIDTSAIDYSGGDSTDTSSNLSTGVIVAAVAALGLLMWSQA